jgi:hypothetical protein
MRPQNHASRPKGIPKTKLQGSGPSGRKTLQSQITRHGKNRLVINALAVVHERLPRIGAGPKIIFLISASESNACSFCLLELFAFDFDLPVRSRSVIWPTAKVGASTVSDAALKLKIFIGYPPAPYFKEP